jgi:hypothetical protein
MSQVPGSRLHLVTMACVIDQSRCINCDLPVRPEPVEGRECAPVA